jgi:hypothetical protein
MSAESSGSKSSESCNATLPDATARDAVQRKTGLCKTKPPEESGARDALCSAPQSPRLCRGSPPRDVAKCQEVSGFVAGDPRFSKTNPPRSLDRLSPRQRAAARLLALGCTIPQTAAELKVARTTIWRWQTLPDFRVELDHLHLWLAGARIGTR